jgi:filamentous hemagglutinin
MSHDAEAKMMGAFKPFAVGAGPALTGWDKPPSGWVWQHATIDQAAGSSGVLQLVPKPQHTPGSPFWQLLHPLPGGGDGYTEWAIPAGAPPN